MYVHVDVLLFSAGKIILNSYAILTGFITKLLALVLFQEILRLDNIFHWFIDNWSKKCPRRSPSQKSDKIPEKTGKRKWFSDVEKIRPTCRICSRSSKTSFGCPFAPNFFAQHCSFSGGRSCLAGCSQLPRPTSCLGCPGWLQKRDTKRISCFSVPGQSAAPFLDYVPHFCKLFLLLVSFMRFMR